MIWPPRESKLFLNPKLPASRQDSLKAAWTSVVEQLRLRDQLEPYIGVATSGSSSEFEQLVAHSVPAFETSAKAVNRRLAAVPGDRWLQTLPEFHVGGLAMIARAAVACGEYISSDLGQVGGWSVDKFVTEMNRTEPQFISIVPAQAYDLVLTKTAPVKSVKALLVGAGRLPSELHSRLKDLGWPVYTSYAMTECASTIAIGDSFGEFKALDHVQLTTTVDGRLSIASEALYLAKTISTGPLGDSKSEIDFLPKRYVSSDIVRVHSWHLAGSKPEPKSSVQTRDGDISHSGNQADDKSDASNHDAAASNASKHTGDFSELKNGIIDIFSVLGRAEDFCKILGESVNLGTLRQQWASLERSHPILTLNSNSQVESPSSQMGFDGTQGVRSEILAAFDMRRGAQLILIYEDEDTQADSQRAKMIIHLVGRFNAAVAPFERIQSVRAIGQNKIPYSPLGKLLSVQALALIGEKPLSNIIRD
jgi:hypothetical protein